MAARMRELIFWVCLSRWKRISCWLLLMENTSIIFVSPTQSKSFIEKHIVPLAFFQLKIF